jgi:uncharacterized protein YkwD
MDSNVPPRSPRRRRTSLTGALVVSSLLATASPAAACDNADAQISSASTGTLRGATMCLLNKRRAAHGLRRLRGDDDLREAAQRYARDMVDRAFFSHVSPSGSDLVDRLRASGFISPSEAWYVGENLAWGSGALGSPRSTVRRWMNSPGHRANILQPRFRHIGIGIAAGAPQPVDGAAATYATNFGD